ncbi:MAG: hypothetical protein KF745_12110 [Phycisphaeraceae bacterium]|nr:hypothetical protein [Phycisphaeraceae bacterium]
MDTNGRQRVLNEAIEARARAESLLLDLAKSRSECEELLRKSGRTDAVKSVTGQSAIDRAIDEARRTMDVLERQISELRGEMAMAGEFGAGDMRDVVAAVEVTVGRFRPADLYRAGA